MNPRHFLIAQSWQELYSSLFNRRYSESGYRAQFGVDPKVTTILWAAVLNLVEEEAIKPVYLLVFLSFIKGYPTFDELAAKFRISRRSTVTWVWKMAELLDDHLREVRFLTCKNPLFPPSHPSPFSITP